ncbi:hypothetical protein NL676_025034 [Syzygium grande]|nr:hypothetical protein NL676_025034 [Syzygium grande]
MVRPAAERSGCGSRRHNSDIVFDIKDAGKVRDADDWSQPRWQEGEKSPYTISRRSPPVLSTTKRHWDEDDASSSAEHRGRWMGRRADGGARFWAQAPGHRERGERDNMI